MSKKKHSKTQQLLEQKRLLQQQLASNISSTDTVGSQNSPELKPVLVSEPVEIADLPSYQPVGLTRTFISTVIIALLLVGSVIVSQKTNYLKTLGNQIFSTLQLSQ